MDTTATEYPDESYQPQILAGGITTFALATIAVFLRFASRHIQRCGYWLDDWLILSAWFLSIGYLVSLIYSVVQDGMGLHVDKVTTDQIYAGRRDLFIEDIAYTLCLVLIKLSVLASYWRIFDIPPIKLPIKILTGIVFCWLIARIPPIFLRCIPLEGYWDPNVDAFCGVNISIFFLGTVSVHLAIDISLLILPVPFIRRLQISRAKKWGIYGIFIIGGFICGSSIGQLVIISQFYKKNETEDVNWDIAQVIMWAAAEVNMTMVSACLPSLRPVYYFVRNGFRTDSVQDLSKQSSSDPRSYGTSNNQTRSKITRVNDASSDLSELIQDEDDIPNAPPGTYRYKVKAHTHSDTIPLNHLESSESGIHVVDEVRVEGSAP